LGWFITVIPPILHHSAPLNRQLFILIHNYHFNS
jgi:hypothetical protein